MITLEQYLYLRDYLDLRKSELVQLKEDIDFFPKSIVFDQIDLDNLLDSWEKSNYTLPVSQIILDDYLDKLTKPYLSNYLSNYTLFWDGTMGKVAITDVEFIKDSFDEEEFYTNLDFILNGFDYYVD